MPSQSQTVATQEIPIKALQINSDVIQRNPVVTKAREKVNNNVPHQFSSQPPPVQRFDNAANMLATPKNNAEKKKAVDDLGKLMTQAGYNQNQINNVINFIDTSAASLRYLIDNGEAAKAKQLSKAISSGELNSSGQILQQMSDWGYHDFVTNQQNAIAANEALVTMTLASLLQQQQASQAQKAMAVTRIEEQLRQINEEVNRTLEEERKKEEDRRQASREGGSAEKKKDEEAPLLDPKSYYEVLQIDNLRTELGNNGMAMDSVLHDTRFQNLFRGHRDIELRSVIRAVPRREMFQAAQVGEGIENVAMPPPGSLTGNALLVAYRKSLADYYALGRTG